ncbi:MAG: hypothetical protein AAFO75_10590, partial [Pseudomonadota bacterium]
HEIIDAVQHTDHAIIGLSASHPSHAVALTRLVVALRIVKPHALILISGGIVELEPEISEIIDADCIAGTAPEAIEFMENFVAASEESQAKQSARQ